MSYIALYRQWRPQDFDNLIGQEHIRTTLKNALASGKIAHAYLFTGPRGTGKTSTAKILAKSLNCVNGPTPEPCNKCPSCDKITSGISMDVLEIDAASNRGIDEIRDLRETVKFAPVDGRFKVYIIDEVHMLTTEAFNALLKTLEEPPGHVVFILATTEPHKIPATIHSRCQRYDFRRISQAEIESRLSDVAAGSGLEVEADALKLIAAHADGGMRDALSILDQCAAVGGDKVAAADVRSTLGLIGHDWVWRLTDAVGRRDPNEALLILDELIKLGRDVKQVLAELAQHARSLLLHVAAPGIVLDSYTGDRQVLERQGKLFDQTRISAWISLLHEAINETKWSADARITAEMALLSACRETSLDMKALVERVERLEQALASGSQLVAAPKSAKETVITPAASSAKPAVQQTDESHNQKPISKAAPVPASEPLAAKGVWDKVLKELVNSGKRMVHACVSQGQLISLDEKLAVVRFSVLFSKERTEKEDYRTIIEQALLRVTGHPVRLQCILNDEKSQPAATEQAQPKATDDPPPIVKQAQQIFGGKVIKLENNREV